MTRVEYWMGLNNSKNSKMAENSRYENNWHMLDTLDGVMVNKLSLVNLHEWVRVSLGASFILPCVTSNQNLGKLVIPIWVYYMNQPQFWIFFGLSYWFRLLFPFLSYFVHTLNLFSFFFFTYYWSLYLKT